MALSYNYDKQTKVKIDVKNLKNTSFRVKYGIEIENTKYFPGTIGSIVETIPKEYKEISPIFKEK